MSTRYYEHVLPRIKHNLQAHCGVEEVVDALLPRLATLVVPTASSFYVLGVVTKALLFDGRRGQYNTERLGAHGHGACLK